MLNVLRRAIDNLLVFPRSQSATIGANREQAALGPSFEPQTSAIASSSRLVDAALIPDLQRQQKLLDLYLFVLDSCLRHGLTQWWRQAVRLPFADLARGLEHLKELCLHELLYGAGDVAAFCWAYEILEQEGHLEGDDDSQYLLALLRFVRPFLKESKRERFQELKAYFDRGNRMPRAVVSVVIPDDSTLSNFQELCLPSLEGKGGLKQLLSERFATMLVFVREQRLAEFNAYLQQKSLDCEIVCQAIPDKLCKDGLIISGGVKRDWLVGSLQYLHLMEAKRLDADFHAINPNAIYAVGFFNQVMRIAKDNPAILSAVVWINSRGLLDRKLVLNEDKSLTISPADLTTTALPVSASTDCATFVEGSISLRDPTAHARITWTGDDCIDIHSTCYEIVFLARKCLRSMPRRFFIRPSTEMDRILGAGAVPHFVTKDDAIAIVEFGHPPGGFCDVAGDPSRFDLVTDRLARSRQAEFFKRPVRLAILRNDQRASVVDTGQGADLRDALSRTLEKVGAPLKPNANQALLALNVLHQYEVSEYGLENMGGTIEEGRRLLDVCHSTAGALGEGPRKELIRAAMNFDYVDKAIALAREGRGNTTFIHEFLIEMMELKAVNAARARALRRRFPLRSFAVLGSIAWGEAFVDKFMNYHVPSLLAGGNIPALARRRKVIHSIVTTERDQERIVAHPVFKHLSKYVHVVFTCFPEKFLEQREHHQYSFYYFYGLLDHQSVFLASALRADLYLLPVDIVLSRDSLKNFNGYLTQGADCCSVAGIECDPAQLRAWLDGRTRGAGGELDLPAKDLLTAAIGLPDAYFRSLIMRPENQSFCRHPRELIWPTPDGLAVHSIFMHPVAVSARLMARPFHPHYENVDFALLPRLLQADGRLKVLEDAREVAAAQFGAPAAREEFLEGGFSLVAFIDAHRYDYAAQRRCFATRQFFPSSKVPYPPSASRGPEVALIHDALKRYRFRTEDTEGH